MQLVGNIEIILTRRIAIKAIDMKIYNSFIKNLLASVLLLIFALAPGFAIAADAWGLPAAPPAGIPTTDLAGIVLRIINYILGFVTLVAILMLIWGGVRYLTAAGDESVVEEAKNIITQAIIGLIIVGISYSIVVVVNVIIGA